MVNKYIIYQVLIFKDVRKLVTPKDEVGKNILPRLKGQACVRYQIKSNQNPFIAS
jgi:hypothetical protein